MPDGGAPGSPRRAPPCRAGGGEGGPSDAAGPSAVDEGRGSQRPWTDPPTWSHPRGRRADVQRDRARRTAWTEPLPIEGRVMLREAWSETRSHVSVPFRPAQFPEPTSRSTDVSPRAQVSTT